MGKEINHEYTEEITCPYCGEELSDSWEEEENEGDEFAEVLDDSEDFVLVLTKDVPITPGDREHAPVVVGEIEISSEKEPPDQQ